MDKIIEALNYKTNDKFYIEHLIILPLNEKVEDENILKQARSIFSTLKTDPNSVLFSVEQMTNDY